MISGANGVKMASSIAPQQPDTNVPTSGGFLNRLKRVGQSLRNTSREDLKTIGLGIAAGAGAKLALGGLVALTGGVGVGVAATLAVAAAGGMSVSLASNAVKHVRQGNSLSTFFNRESMKKAYISALFAAGTAGTSTIFETLMGETMTHAVGHALGKATDYVVDKTSGLFSGAHALSAANEKALEGFDYTNGLAPVRPSTPITPLAEVAAQPSAPASSPLKAVIPAATPVVAPIPSITPEALSAEAVPIPSTVTTLPEVTSAADQAVIPTTVTTEVPTVSTPEAAPVIPSTVTTISADTAPTPTVEPTNIIPTTVTEAPVNAAPATVTTLDNKGALAFKTYGDIPHPTMDPDLRERALAIIRKPFSAFKSAVGRDTVTATPAVTAATTVSAIPANPDFKLTAEVPAGAGTRVLDIKGMPTAPLEAADPETLVVRATNGAELKMPAAPNADAELKIVKDAIQTAGVEDATATLDPQKMAATCLANLPSTPEALAQQGNTLVNTCMASKDVMNAGDYVLVRDVAEANPTARRGLRVLFTQLSQKTADFITQAVGKEALPEMAAEKLAPAVPAL